MKQNYSKEWAFRFIKLISTFDSYKWCLFIHAQEESWFINISNFFIKTLHHQGEIDPENSNYLTLNLREVNLVLINSF